MKKQNLYNKLKLSFSPLSNYDYAYLKAETNLDDYLNKSSLYIITQRQVLTFENLNVDRELDSLPILKFQIKQKGNDKVLECSFPIRQEVLSNLNCKKVLLSYHFDYEFANSKQDCLPFNHLRDFSIYCDEGNSGAWFTPEKFLYDYWNSHLVAEIKGDIMDFLKYKVHYIGKSTEDNVVKRLTGHEHLQDILSTEFPFSYSSLPTDEIAILFLEFEDNVYMNFYGDDNEEIDEMLQHMTNRNLPCIPEKTIYLDAEKALINALKPKHNKIFYKKYPLSKDGLEKHGLDYYTYSFLDPISLVYDNGIISGSEEFFCDMLVVKKGEPLHIITKHSQTKVPFPKT